MGHPDAQNAAAVDPEGEDSPERHYLDPDRVVDLTADPEEADAEGAADVAMTCAVAGLAVRHGALRSPEDD